MTVLMASGALFVGAALTGCDGGGSIEPPSEPAQPDLSQ